MWLKRLQEQVGSEVTNEKLKDFIWSTLKSGQVRGRGSGRGQCDCHVTAGDPGLRARGVA